MDCVRVRRLKLDDELEKDAVKDMEHFLGSA